MSGVLKVGIIGGSGLEDQAIIENIEEVSISTPYGEPSDVIIEGIIDGVPCAILPRHGRNHSIAPSDVNFRANIWALKQRGCSHVLASNACGGLQEHTQPGDLVVVDQFFDRTTKRINTFFDGQPSSPQGVVHLPMAEPFCAATRKILIKSAQKVIGHTYLSGRQRTVDRPHVHTEGSCVIIEGPRFSSRCESKLFHAWGLDVINMTMVPEVILAKEAGLSYASIAIVTDFDSWKENVESVNVAQVLTNFKKSADSVKKIFIETIRLLKEEDWTKIIAHNKELVQNSRQDTH